MSKKILIVGGVAGGASTAARLRRLDEFANIIIFERGEYISFANCGLPYHIGDVIKKREKLIVQTTERMKNRFNIDVRIKNEVIKIFPSEKKVQVKDLVTDNIYFENYDKLVLSPGAKPIKLPIKGLNSNKYVFTLRNMEDMDRINAAINKDDINKAVVIGGGFIGIEIAENLKLKGLEVILVEKKRIVNNFFDIEMAAFLQQHIKSKGINLIQENYPVDALEENKKIKIKLNSGKEIIADMVILGIGTKPEVDLAKDARLKIGKFGGIQVNEFLQTSNKDIYAVGDAIEVEHIIHGGKTLIPLAGPATRQGRIVANNIHGIKESYDGVIGTTIIKVFDLTAAATGLTESILKANNNIYQKCYIHSNNHASYYPGSTPLSMKLIFHPSNGKIYGAQAIGTSGVDKRIDVIATAIKAGLTIYNLQKLELCYAPPFNTPRDPVNYLGYVAENIINSNNPIFNWDDLRKRNKDRTVLIDVRTVKEYNKEHLDSAINIPLDELRIRIKELPKDKELWVYCRAGLRGYIAARMLIQRGYRVKNLNGGYKTYQITILGDTNIDTFMS